MNAFASRVGALTVLAGIALAGCGESSTAEQASAAATAMVKAFPVPTPVGWERVDAGTDQTFVVVRALGDDLPCVVYRSTVRESPQQVEIAVLKDASGCVGDTTPKTKAPPELRVQLEDELGERELIGAGPNNAPADAGLTNQ